MTTKETERQRRQADLDGRRTLAERNALGQYATPKPLAVEMAKLARSLWHPDARPVRFLDPAVGSGSFYSALRHVFPDRSIESALGVELDHEFADLAQELWTETGLHVQRADFTRLTPPSISERATLVLANPPYVRHHHLGREEKQRLQQLVASTLRLRFNGLGGLYCYFLLLAHRWMAEDGLALWLIPSEFLDVNYGQTIREYLQDRVSLLQIHRFDPSDAQFADALVSSAVVVFRASAPSRDQTALFTYGGTLTEPRVRQEVALEDLPATAKWSAYPRANGIIRRAHGPTLSHYFTIKRGIATGANDFFILPRERAREFSVPERFLRPILPSPRHMPETIIEAGPDGYPVLEKQLALIDCDLSEQVLAEQAPALFEYLASAGERGIRERYLVRKREPWYRQEQRLAAPFLCTYMGRGVGKDNPFRFIWNKSQAITANVYLLLYPKGDLLTTLETNESLYPKVFEALCALDPDTLRSGGRVYGGGLHKLEPRELGDLPADGIAALIRSGVRSARQFSLFVREGSARLTSAAGRRQRASGLR